jgi:hypothetical protein
MKRLFFGLLISTALVCPANAIYTQCTVQKDMQAVSRPGGETEPRWPSLEKGEKVAIRSTYNSKTNESATFKSYDWVFIIHYVDHAQWFGWIPANVLVNCQSQEGTPF